jgi:hypothetical protein
MVAPTFGAGYTQWVGQAPETTYGTAQAVPTFWTPATAPVYTPNLTMLVDDALRGSMAMEFGQVAGFRYDTVVYKTYFYLDTVYLFLRQILGSADLISGSGPYVHKASLQNTNNGQPQGTTLFFNAFDKTWQMPGAILQEVKITLAGEALATVELSYMGLPSTAITAPTNTPTTAVAMPTWNSTITLAGASTNRYTEVDLDIKRTVQAIDVINGTQAPGAIFAGPVQVSGNFKAVYAGSTDVDLVNYLTNNQPTLLIKTAAVGDSVNSIQFQLSKVGYDKSAFVATDKYYEISSAIRGIAQATDATANGTGLSMMQAILTSSVSTAI